MNLGIEVARISRAILVCLTAVLTVYGVVACSSDVRSAPTSLVPPTIVMPDIVGMYWPDAEPKLRSAGRTGVLVKVPTCRQAATTGIASSFRAHPQASA